MGQLCINSSNWCLYAQLPIIGETLTEGHLSWVVAQPIIRVRRWCRYRESVLEQCLQKPIITSSLLAYHSCEARVQATRAPVGLERPQFLHIYACLLLEAMTIH
jgi:hypothetical protein